MIYLVMGIGQIDCSDWPVKAFRSRPRAEAFAKECIDYSAPGCPEYDAWLWGNDETEEGQKSADAALVAWRDACPDKSGQMVNNSNYVVREVAFDEEIDGA